MAKFLKNMKSLFVTGEESPKQKKKSGKEQPSSQPQAPVGNTQPQIKLTKADIDGKVDDKFLDILLEAMNEENQEGFDYLEYKQSLMSLKEMHMEESMRYKSAFAMAQTMGTTPDYLLKTAAHYLKALSKEEEKFLEAMESQQKRKLETASHELRSLKESVGLKEKQIEDLKVEIKQSKEKLKTQTEDFENIQKKIVRTKANFEASYEHLAGQIRTDVEKINSYLK